MADQNDIDDIEEYDLPEDDLGIENVEGIDLQDVKPNKYIGDIPFPTKIRPKSEPAKIPSRSESSEIQRTESGRLLQNYLDYYVPGNRNIEIYNNWLFRTLQGNIQGRTVRMGDGTHYLKLEDPKIIPPCYIKNNVRLPLTPQYCRLNGKTYDVVLKANMKLYKITDSGDVQVGPSLPLEIGRIPLMLKSGACILFRKDEEQLQKYGEDPYEPGGYFIIKGKEKTVIFQEQMAFNKLYIFKLKKKLCCRITCQYMKRNSTMFQISYDPKTKYVEVEFVSIKKKKENVEKNPKNQEYATFNAIRLLRFLGVGLGIVVNEDGLEEINNAKCRQEIRNELSKFIPEKYLNDCMNKLAPSIVEASKKYSGSPENGKKSDIEYLADIFKYNTTSDKKKKLKKNELVKERLIEPNEIYVNRIINNDVFPQLSEIPKMEGETLDHFNKRIEKYRREMVIQMVAKMAMYLAGHIKLSDRDSWSNKKIEGAGRLMESLFKTSLSQGLAALSSMSKTYDLNSKGFDFEKFLEDLRRAYEVPNIGKDKQPSESLVTSTFVSSFVSPSWGVKSKEGKNNVVQILNRDGKLATYSHLDTLDVNVPRDSQQPGIRDVQKGQYGGICAVTVSEGENCGLLKALCILVRISLDRLDIYTIYDQVYKSGIYSDEKSEIKNTRLCFNGFHLGWCDGDHAQKYLLGLRRTGFVPWDVSIIRHTDLMGNWLHIDTTPSRVMRPLLVVEDGQLLIDKENMWDASITKLLETGCLEYISLWEQEYTKLASSKKVVVDFENDKKKRKITIQDFEKEIAALKKKNPNYGKYVEHKKSLKALENELESDLITKKQFDKQSEKINAAMQLILKKNTNTKTIEELEEKLNVEKYMYEKLLKKRPYTHCEIDPTATLGIAASMIPLPDHSQAPRNTYQTGMSKQALSNPHTNHFNRFDGKTKKLIYPSRPIFETETASSIHLDKTGTGFMAILAFLAFPYTEEDAFIFKKEFIECGASRMAKSISFFSTRVSNEKYDENFMRPPKINDKDEKRYTYIQSNGLPCLNAPLKEKDCVIGKMRTIKNTNIIENQSTFLKIGEEGVVEKVYVSGNTVKVRISITRIPLFGDKFSPRNAQKSTIGLIMAEKDLPYNEKTGTTPDIITNPHQIPSRMTLSYPLELILSKCGYMECKRVNGSAFTKINLEKASKVLKKYGYNEYGTEQLRSGLSGRKYDKETFMGPVFFQALKHHPIDKIQGRSTGPIKSSTRQPYGGRNKGGGLRFGEMERDGVVSWGASSVIQERLCYVSDAYDMIFCRQCGEYALHRPDGTLTCVMCGEHNNFGQKVIPWVSTLLTRLCAAANIRLNLEMEYNEETKNKLLYAPVNPPNREKLEKINYDLVEDVNKKDEKKDEDEEEPLF